MNPPSNHPSAKSACRVRPPEPRDYDQMAELARQLGYPCTKDELKVRLDDMHDSNQYGVYVAEFPGAQIAGWIGVYIYRTLVMDKCAEIHGLVVDQEQRSVGIGKVLLDVAEEWARKQSCGVISVRSNVTRERAHGFYMKNGYARTKSQATLLKSL